MEKMTKELQKSKPFKIISPTTRKEPSVRILIASDDENCCTQFQNLLEKKTLSHYQLQRSTEWQDAKNRIESNEYSVCLIDAELNDGKGFKLLENIHNTSHTSALIMLLNEELAFLSEQVLSKGADDYLVKETLEPLMLEHVLRNCVALGRAQFALKFTDSLNETLHTEDQKLGLGNQKIFNKCMGEALARVSRNKQTLAILLLEIDQLQTIADDKGHETIEQILTQLAKRLRKNLRKNDQLYRMQANQIAIGIEGKIDEHKLARVAQNILEMLQQPFTINNESIHLTFNIGISSTQDSGYTPERLLDSSENALATAKKLGENNFQFYSKTFTQKIIKHLTLENALKEAIKKNHFLIDYQPIFDLKNKNIVAAEALLRWKKNGKQLIEAGRFISVAQTSNLICEIGQWVIYQVCQHLNKWKKCSPSTDFPKITINLSERELSENQVFTILSSALKENKVSPELLEIEIEENDLINNSHQYTDLLTRLASLNLSISIAKFGGKYTSLPLLKTLPIDTIKIESSYVENIVDNPQDQRMVQAIIAFAKKLNIRVIAQNVENKQQANLLSQYGCDQAQGNYFSKPMTNECFIESLVKPEKRNVG